MTQKKTEERKQADVSERISGAYKRVFSTEDGKTVLDDMMMHSGFLEGKYEGDPNDVVFREGVRSHMARTLKMLVFDPRQFREYVERLNKERDNGVTY